jgi:UDP-2,3-diacylglucosamine pyrophosphatase LpxH
MDSLKNKIGEWETIQFTSSINELKPTLNHKKFDTEKLVLSLIGDSHIGSKYFDEDLFKEIIDWSCENKAYAILMGDMIEAATRDSVGAGVYEQNEIIDKQITHFYKLITPLVDEGLVLGMHPGNHELRVYKSSGLDIAKMMCRELKIPYLGWGKLHYFKVGNEGYSLYTTHGSSGARMPHTKIKGVIDLANMVDAQIYAMGHLHQLSHHVRNFYEINKRSRTVDEDQKHFVLTGSFLNHWGSYGHVMGYEPMRKGSPKIKLHGDEHKIRVTL